jgi:hypothetical protein
MIGRPLAEVPLADDPELVPELVEPEADPDPDPELADSALPPQPARAAARTRIGREATTDSG